MRYIVSGAKPPNIRNLEKIKISQKDEAKKERLFTFKLSKKPKYNSRSLSKAINVRHKTKGL